MKVLKTTKKNSESLTQRVYEDLRMAVITGKVTGGTRLVESTLAADMQVSRTPIREALHQSPGPVILLRKCLTMIFRICLQPV